MTLLDQLRKCLAGNVHVMAVTVRIGALQRLVDWIAPALWLRCHAALLHEEHSA